MIRKLKEFYESKEFDSKDKRLMSMLLVGLVFIVISFVGILLLGFQLVRIDTNYLGATFLTGVVIESISILIIILKLSLENKRRG